MCNKDDLEYSDSLKEYADPIIFDAENKAFSPDGPFYLEMARQTSGPVLQLGCGTGRLTIPFAQQGIDITAIDIVPEMLQSAKSKAEDLPIRWVEADVRTFRLETEFQFIFTTGGLFHHMLNRCDQEAMLARVREHLTPEGRFVVDVWFKRPESMVDVPEEQNWDSYVAKDGREVRVSGTDHYDHMRQIWYQTTYRHWRDSDGNPVTRCVKLALRYMFPQEMEALLHYNGFQVLSRYGDWGKSPLTDGKGCQIYVCVKHQ